MVGYMLHIKILREKERERERLFAINILSLSCLKISLWERCTIFYATSKTSQVRIMSKSTLTALHEFRPQHNPRSCWKLLSLFVARSGNRCWWATRAFDFFLSISLNIHAHRSLIVTFASFRYSDVELSPRKSWRGEATWRSEEISYILNMLWARTGVRQVRESKLFFLTRIDTRIILEFKSISEAFLVQQQWIKQFN